MKYNLHTAHLDLTELDQKYLDNKLDRIVKYLKNPYTADVTFSRNTHHKQGSVISCKINITQGKGLIHADREAETAQDALDMTIEAIKHSLAKLKDKQKSKRWSIKNLFLKE